MAEMNIVFLSIVLVILLGFSAFFSGSETALMAISRLRLRHLAEKKPVRARLVARILRKPEQLIGTILLGNNLVNVLMSAIATALAITLWGERGIVYATGTLTFAILIFAEITPKVYAKYFNERVSFMTAPVLNVIMLLSNPIVILVTYLSNKILYLLGIDVSKIKRPLMTEEEVRTCIKMGWDEGAVTDEEKRMLERVFTLNDKTVEDIMVPKEKMKILALDAPLDETIKMVLKTGFSRFPVMDEKKSEIVGIVHAKDLFSLIGKKKQKSLKKILRPPFFVPAEKKIDAQLRRFKADMLHQSIVLDRKGNVIGLVTIEDILEELVGSIKDEHDQ